MGMEKRTIKIIVAIVAVVLLIGIILGVLLTIFLPYRYVELEVWPRSEDYNRYEPLIHFRASDPGSWHVWYKRINDFLRDELEVHLMVGDTSDTEHQLMMHFLLREFGKKQYYETTVPEEPPRAPCSTQRHDQRLPVPSCERALNMWAPCNADNFYGYAAGKPCVFLRLNHIHYWVPEPYNTSKPMDIPLEMPNNIKQFMQQRPAHHYGDFIWVSCNGEFNSDEENVGPIQLIPANLPPGFPTNRLNTADRIPYSARNLPDQTHGPLVAVFFENPRRGVVINVECRIWTRDIVYSSTSRVGHARFELYIQ